MHANYSTGLPNAANPSVASGAISGGVTFAGNHTEPVLSLDAAIGDISRTNQDLVDLLTAARNYADSLLGSQPEPANGSGASTPKMPSRLAGLRDSVEMNAQLVAALRVQFDRIRSF